jgi:hypothetical protein
MGSRTVVHVVRVSLIIGGAAAVGIIGTSTAALVATAASTATTASVATATSIVLPKLILETLALSMDHARMERAWCIGISVKIEA